jgi:hypothetical protein
MKDERQLKEQLRKLQEQLRNWILQTKCRRDLRTATVRR